MGKKKHKKTMLPSQTIPIPPFISPLSKTMFILLSIGGHLTATDYADFLDNAPFESDDDDIDEVINAMEYHEHQRLNLSKAIQRLADAIANTSSSSSSSSSSLSNKDNDLTQVHVNHFDMIETCVSRLSSIISSYRILIAKQRRLVAELHYSYVDLVKTTTITAPPTTTTTTTTLTDFTHDKFSHFLKYGVVLQVLSQQYIRQLDWEARCSSKVAEILMDGSIYSHLIRVRTRAGDDNYTNKTNTTNSNSNSNSNSISIHHYLRKCARGYAQCVMLDHENWQAVKQTYLEEVMSIADVVNPSDEIGMNSQEVIHEHEESARTGITTEMESTLLDNVLIPSSTKYPPVTSVSCTSSSVLQSRSIQGAINAFIGHTVFSTELYEPSPPIEGLDNPATDTDTDTATATTTTEMPPSGAALFLLLKGAPGIGKTYFCDEVETKLSQLNQGSDENSQIVVIRPRLPADFLGPSVGAFEDSLLSLFSHIESMTKLKKCILILDNIEHILGPEYADSNVGNKSKIGLGSTRRDHLSFRIKNVFLAVMDRMRRSEQHSHSSERKGLLVICTSRSHDDGIVDRFDKVFHLDNPSSIERRYLIELGLGLILSIVPIEGWDGRVTEVVSATVGKSRGDIAQFCREAIESVPQITSEHTYMSRLDAMRNSLQSILPESVRNTSADGMVEMRVSSAKELRQKVRLDDNGNTVFPLLGENMLESWKQLESIIIAPLCRRDSLDVLLYGNAKNSQTLSQRKATSSGVLVSGDPGVGKTALAYHCAAVAAGFNPAIRLLEVSCTSLIHKEVGGSERSLHKLFEAARAAAPCILLLDGIETIAPVRGKDNTTEGTMDRLLSTLLTEMDGVASGGQSTSDKESSNSIGVIGITHNPPSWIDPALLRPGRLEKCIKLEKPDNTARKAIFLNAISGAEIDFSGAGFFDPKDYSQLADAVTMKTPGRSAAEIIALFDNAKMLALKEILADANGEREEYTNISISFRHFLGRG